MMMIDLHMHTTLSDGTDTPEEVIERVREAEIGLFSVTDHDSIAAGNIVPPLLQTQGPDFIRGVEFSCKDENGKYHILGYGYDPKIPGIADVVMKGHELRMRKTTARLEFLKDEFGFIFPEEEIQELLNLNNPGKPHIAKMMIRNGYAETIEQAITDYIDKKKFKNVHVRPEEAIEGILKSNGIPVLAHPAYGDGDDLIMGEDLEARIRYLMEYGLEGVEAFYSGFTPRIQNEVLGLAEKYDLYVTAGSDYHGSNKMVDLGWTNLESVDEWLPGLTRFLEQVDILESGSGDLL